MKRFLLLFFTLSACVLAQSQPRPASGGGVVNGQQLKDNDGNVFLDAGEHVITSSNWNIVDDGSASFANGGFTIDSNANITNVTSIAANGISGFQLNADGSASFAGGVVNIYSNGEIAIGNPTILDLNVDGSGLFTSIGVGNGSIALNADGSASFAGGGLSIGSDGGISLNAPAGDPGAAGQLYQDPITHAVFVSQGP